MNKIVFLLFFLFSFPCFLEAQTVYTSTGKKSNNKSKKNTQNESIFRRENVILGGNFGFNAFTQGSVNRSYFEINPQVGLQVKNFYHSGISVDYTYYRVKYLNYYNPVSGATYDYKLLLPSWNVGWWNRLFVIPQFFASVELNYSFYKYASGNLDDNGNPERVSGSSPAILVGLGYANRFAKNSRNYIAMWLNYDVLQNPNSPYFSDNDLINGLFYKFGFYIGI